MGLTIHYSLKAGGSESKARKLVHLLHQAAQDLPFTSVGEVVDLKGALADERLCPPGHPLTNLLFGGCEWLEYDRRSIGPDSFTSRTAQIHPKHLIGFQTVLGEGCESGRFGLCRYPAFVEVGLSRRIRTGLGGWRWKSFCKTQYASNPKCGGVENFLRCHLSVVAVLDKAKAVGFDVEVDDEGGFWSKRSVPDLVREVGTCNEDMPVFSESFNPWAGRACREQSKSSRTSSTLKPAARTGPNWLSSASFLLLPARSLTPRQFEFGPTAGKCGRS